MKSPLAFLLLTCSLAHAGGSAYYISSHVTITGPASLAVVQPGTSTEAYAVAASTPLTYVYVTGDTQFSLAAPCIGQTSCVATLSLAAALGGDYSTTFHAIAGQAGRVRAGSTFKLISAHVVGANYSLDPSTSTDSTATFLLTSTGEIPLKLTSIKGGDYFDSTDTLLNSGRVTLAHDCPPVMGPGSVCSITASFNSAGLESDIGWYNALVAVQVEGNTRTQPAAGITLYVPL